MDDLRQRRPSLRQRLQLGQEGRHRRSPGFGLCVGKLCGELLFQIAQLRALPPFFTTLTRRALDDRRTDFDLVSFLRGSDEHTWTFAGDPARGTSVCANQSRRGFSDGLNVAMEIEEIRMNGSAVHRSVRGAGRPGRRDAGGHRIDGGSHKHDRRNLLVCPPRSQTADSL